MPDTQLEQLFPADGKLCPSVSDTRQAARDLVALLSGKRAILSLEGPLGAGKTCFVQGLAEALACDPKGVSSPTFSLIHEYSDGPLPFVHMDLYRLESSEELEALGFDDLFVESHLTAIEWGDKFLNALPPDTIRLGFSIEHNEQRRIRLIP
jgi:tRNA threonylcarbamoyladenosine biosynthesis protein TsaE